jgi:16S rRNA (guanine1516-N2)-methyltransferase
MKLIIQLCDQDNSQVQELIELLSCDVVHGYDAIISDDYSHILRSDQHGLSLISNSASVGQKTVTPTRVDFLDAGLQHRRLTSGKSQGIAKAIGLNKLKSPTVLDATAGLGKDAYILASLGCTVTMLERSPIIHALLEDGFRRGLESIDADVIKIINEMTLINIDAKNYLDKIITEKQDKPDVIYLDPMFPPRSKSAKVKKDISLLQQVLGIDEDFDELFNAAKQCAKHRVVVKRPGKKTKDSELKPSFQIEGKSAHFDVFV